MQKVAEPDLEFVGVFQAGVFFQHSDVVGKLVKRNRFVRLFRKYRVFLVDVGAVVRDGVGDHPASSANDDDDDDDDKDDDKE